jgi:MFS superfamily sulfate permease-like transporter
VFLVRFVPKIPAPLVAVAGGIAASALLNLPAHGVEEVGRIPTGLPPVTLPDLSLIGVLWSGAIGIALMSFTETAAAGRAFADPGEPIPRANRELFATGIGNAAGALLGAMASGGGTSQTAVNRRAGARSQTSELVTAGVTLATMLLLAPIISRMPQATLASVVVIYSLGLIKPAEFWSILRIRRLEFLWAIAALVGVMVLGTLNGIVLAIILSLVALAQQVANPPVYVIVRKRGTNVFRPASPEHPDDESFPGLLLLRPEGRIFFANAERVGERMRTIAEQTSPVIVAIDMSGVFDLEYTALKMLIAAEKDLRGQGVEVWLVDLPPAVLEMVRRSGLGDTLGRERMHFNLESTVARYLERRGELEQRHISIR